MGPRIDAGTCGRGALIGLSMWLALGVTIAVPTSTAGTLALLPSVWVLAGEIMLAIGLLQAARPRQVPWPLVVLACLCMGAAWLPIPPLAAVRAWTGAPSLPLLVLAGALAIGPLAARLPLWTSDRVAPWIAAALAVAWMTIIGLALNDRSITGDEPHYLLIAQSVLADGDFDLQNNYDARDLQAYYPGPLEPRHVSLGVLGQEFSFHAPGASMLALPAFALGGPVAARLFFALLLASSTGLLWVTIRCVTTSPAAAWAGWASFVLCAPASLNGEMIYPDGPGAMVTILALWALARSEDAVSPPAQATLTAIGLALATLPWLHLRLGLVAACFGIGLAVAAWRRSDAWARLVCLFAAPIASASMLVAASWTMFRTLDPTAIFRQQAAGSLAAAPTGLLGLLFDHEYGLLPYAPCLALAPLGLLLARKRHPMTAASGTAAAAGTLLVAASWVWWGGQSAPARFLVPVLPILAFGAGVAWSTCRGLARAFTGIGLAFSATLTLLMATADDGAYAVNVPDGVGSIFNWLSPSVDIGSALPSLFRSGTSLGHEAAIAFVWVAAFSIAGAALRAQARTTVAAAAVAAVAACTGAAAAAWTWRGVSPWTPARAQLTLLHAGANAALPIAAEASWPHVVSRADLWSRVSITTPNVGDALLRVPLLPAGRYRVEVEPRTSASLTLELGQNAWPLAAWQVNAGEPFTFAAAFPVWAARVTADEDTTPCPQVTLRPLHVVTADPDRPELAWRVSAYGALVVYSLDRASYPEPGGLWLAADRQATLAVTDRDGRARAAILHLEAGIAPVTATIDDDRGWHTNVALAPGASADVRMPRPDEATRARLTFSVRGGFMASDRRHLGVWLEMEPLD